mmetsp:Transcript_26330/g.67062  ORF Transcript_26330/g.67062 Transcript_26330/m.67062 type:complete len:183 (-) Transcript_26330:1228-1776(-)
MVAAEGNCAVCSEKTRKYTCPVCKLKICSLPCSKEHKGSQVCSAEVKRREERKGREEEAKRKREEREEGEKTSEEGEKEEKEELLNAVQKRRIEQSERVRDLLTDDVKMLVFQIAAAKNPSHILKKAMENHSFLLLSEVLLREIGVRDDDEEVRQEEEKLKQLKSATAEEYFLSKLQQIVQQ